MVAAVSFISYLHPLPTKKVPAMWSGMWGLGEPAVLWVSVVEKHVLQSVFALSTHVKDSSEKGKNEQKKKANAGLRFRDYHS